VGFWGVKIVARTDRELAALTSVADFDGEFGNEVALEQGWRVATIHRGSASDDALAAMVAETGAPILVAEVADSDFAVVGFASPDQQIRYFVLHPGSAEGYEHPVDEAAQAAAPAALVAWAGGSAIEAEVIQAVRGRMLFAEDSVRRLAGALGAFPIDELKDYIFGPLPDESETR
jgi:hypothetical protein